MERDPYTLVALVVRTGRKDVWAGHFCPLGDVMLGSATLTRAAMTRFAAIFPGAPTPDFYNVRGECFQVD